MPVSNDFTKCPICFVQIKEHNLEKHLNKVHKQGISSVVIQHRYRRSKITALSTNTPWKPAINTKTDINWQPYEPISIKSLPSESHDPRDYQLKMEKCPHGVIKSAICGVCNPEEFRKYMGID